MLKITDGERTICAGPYLDEKGIVAAITNLRDLIKEIGKYPDKSLFFQKPLVLEGWIQMVRLLQGVKKWEVPEGDEQWVECAEIYVAYLFEMRALCDSYKEIYKIYHNHLWKLLEFYNGWLEGEYISFDCMDALYEDKYEKGLQDVENIGQYAAQLNKESHEARFAVDTILSHAYDLLMAIMNRGGKVIIDLYPTESDFALAFDADIRTRTRSIKEQMFKDMEEELARHYMECRTDDYTPQMWSKMLVADEDALKMAKKKQLSKCEEPNQEHWGKDIKAKMDGNSKLMEKILSLIKTKELFDLGKPENVKPLIGLLEPENLSLFYDIIIRRSLIQCEMFPNLKEQHETWLYGRVKLSDDNNTLNKDCHSGIMESNALNHNNGVFVPHQLCFFDMSFFGSEEKQPKLIKLLRDMCTKFDVKNGRGWFVIYAGYRYYKKQLGVKDGYTDFFTDIEALVPDMLTIIDKTKKGKDRYHNYTILLGREAKAWYMNDKNLPPLNEITTWKDRFNGDKNRFTKNAQLIIEVNNQLKQI